MESTEILFYSLGALAAAGAAAVVWLNARGEGGRENLGKRIGGVDDKVGEVEKDAAVLKADRDRINARLELLEGAAKKAVCKDDLRGVEDRVMKRIDALAAELKENRK